MPCELIVDPKLRVIHSRYHGEVTTADVLSQRALMAAHPDFDPRFSLIIDLSGATRIAMKASEVHQIAKSPTPLQPLAIHILVAPLDGAFGIARMYQILAEEIHPNTAVVRTMEEARKLASEFSNTRQQLL